MWFVVSRVVALATVLFFAVGGHAVAQKQYDLNVMEPLSGGGAFLGAGQRAALQLLAGAVNKTAASTDVRSI